MITHIDTLNAWWSSAERGEAEPGDWIITHSPDDTNPAYIIEQAPHYPLSSKRQPYRILHRAPKPVPAWHNAVAVIAGYPESREAYTRTETGLWESANCLLYAHELIDPVPLIEATVTDEMVLRALNASTGLDLPHHTSYKRDEVEDMRFALHAALNLDPA